MLSRSRHNCPPPRRSCPRCVPLSTQRMQLKHKSYQIARYLRSQPQKIAALHLCEYTAPQSERVRIFVRETLLHRPLPLDGESTAQLASESLVTRAGYMGIGKLVIEPCRAVEGRQLRERSLRQSLNLDRIITQSPLLKRSDPLEKVTEDLQAPETSLWPIRPARRKPSRRRSREARSGPYPHRFGQPLPAKYHRARAARWDLHSTPDAAWEESRSSGQALPYSQVQYLVQPLTSVERMTCAGGEALPAANECRRHTDPDQHPLVEPSAQTFRAQKAL